MWKQGLCRWDQGKAAPGYRVGCTSSDMSSRENMRRHEEAT